MAEGQSEGPALPAPLAPSGSPFGTIEGARTIRSALGRLELLVAFSIAVSLLSLARSALGALGYGAYSPTAGPGPFNVWWPNPGEILSVVLAVVTAVLVIAAIVLAITGWLRWRAGIVSIARSRAEVGGFHASLATRAEGDYHATMWMLVGFVVVSIAVGIALGTVSAAAALGAPLTPPSAETISFVMGVPAAALLVLVYYFGTRSVRDAIFGASTPQGQAELDSGRTIMLVAALVGWFSVFGAYAWPVNILQVVSLVLVLVGVRRLEAGYDRWLTGWRAQAPRAARWAPAST